MIPPRETKPAQLFVVWKGGSRPGTIARLSKLKNDSYGGTTRPPILTSRGETFECPWVFLRRLTPYTLLGAVVLWLFDRLKHPFERYVLGTR